jgi:hypothetical protein
VLAFPSANELEWDKFPVLKSRARSHHAIRGIALLKKMRRNGEIAKSTTENYIKTVIRFYKCEANLELIPDLFHPYFTRTATEMPFQISFRGGLETL